MGDIDQETLKNNFKKLKLKIIDTGKLVELYKSTQRKLEQALQRENNLKNQLNELSQIYGIRFERESANFESNSSIQYDFSIPIHETSNSHLKLKMSSAYEALKTLNQRNWNLEKEVQRLKNNIESKDTIIQSNQALIQQLQAKLEVESSSGEGSTDYETLKKENRELKSALSSKDQKIESLRNKIIELKRNLKKINSKQVNKDKEIISNTENDVPIDNIEIPEIEMKDIEMKEDIKEEITTENKITPTENKESVEIPTQPKPLKKPNIQKISRNTIDRKPMPIENRLTIKPVDSIKIQKVDDSKKVIPSLRIKHSPISSWDPYEDIDTLEKSITDAITKYGKCKNDILNNEQVQLIKEISFRCSDFQSIHIIISFINCIIAIIHKLQLTNEKLYEIIENGFDYEHFILTLFWNIAHNHQIDSIDNIISNFLAHISSILIFKKDLNDIALVILTRILTKFCQLHGSVDRIKIFLYDLIKERYDINIKIILSIDSIDKILQSLMSSTGYFEKNTSILGLTILNVLDDHFISESKDNLTEEKKYLINQWNNKVKMNHENSFKSISEWIEYLFNLFIKIKMNEIMADNDIIFEIIKSIELIYKVKGSNYVDSILEKIDPLSLQYLRSLLNR